VTRAATAARLAAIAAFVSCAAPGCRRKALPPRPDGAAVVVAQDPNLADGDVKPVPEVEPNDKLAQAQRLLVGVGAPAGIAGELAAGAKPDADLYRVDIPAPDAGAPPPAGADAGPPKLQRRSLRVELRPDPTVAVVLEALDDVGHVLVSTSAGQLGEPVTIPNLAVAPGAYHVRARSGAAGSAGRYRLIVRLGPLDAGSELEPNGSAELASELLPGAETVGYLGWRHDQDWYRVPTAGLAEGTVLSVDLEPIPDVAVALQLLDGAARKLVESRGRKGERVALRNVRVPAGDPHVFILVRADAGSSAEVRYNLRVRGEVARPGGGDAEPNDDVAHAQPIGEGTLLGFLGRGDVDVFRVQAAASEVDVEVVPPERVDVKLEVLRADGSRLARADAGRRRESERLPNIHTEGGQLLLRLSAGGADGNPDEPYRLTIASRTPEPGDEAEPNDTIATPTALVASQHGRGLIAPRGDADFWKLSATPDAEGALHVTVTGIQGMTLSVRVRAEGGRELAKLKVPNQPAVSARVVPGAEACCIVEIRGASGKEVNVTDRYQVAAGAPSGQGAE
jgi:hypothetical protein